MQDCVSFRASLTLLFWLLRDARDAAWLPTDREEPAPAAPSTPQTNQMASPPPSPSQSETVKQHSRISVSSNSLSVVVFQLHLSATFHCICDFELSCLLSVKGGLAMGNIQRPSSVWYLSTSWRYSYPCATVPKYERRHNSSDCVSFSSHRAEKAAHLPPSARRSMAVAVQTKQKTRTDVSFSVAVHSFVLHC